MFGEASTVLLSTGWASKEQIESMTDIEIKTMLIENLNKNLDEDTHSMPELSYR